MAGADRANRDRGAGLLSTSFGILFFLGFLFFAVQLLFNLYATSVVTSVTHDAARYVATIGHPATQADMDAAEARAKQDLGDYAKNVRFEWDAYSNPDVIRLRVIAQNPRFLGPVIDTFVGFDVIDRTVEVRVEQFR